MRIGLICYPTIGGSGLVATQLGLNLARRGHQVHFISYSAPFKLPQFERNVQFHSVDPISYPLFNHSLYTFALVAKIVEVISDYGLDVVHAHYSIPHSLCAHLAREVAGKDFRIVTTLHGTDVTVVGQDKPLFPLNRYGILQSDAVTTVSAYQSEYAQRYFDLGRPVEVIYNFVDTDVFRPVAERCPHSFLAEADELLVMHISNFRQPKNPLGVARTFSKVLAAGVRARLVLIGDGPGITEIKALCRELDICRKVTFLGNVQSVEEVLPAADVVLQPSYRESFGMVLLEAMAAGVATVSSNVDGIPEVIAAGETGFMAPPDDHDSLAGHIIRLAADDALRQQLGAAGRRRAVEHFSQDHIVPQYEALYERVRANPPGNGA